jgi:alcohol dehydrogenase
MLLKTVQSHRIDPKKLITHRFKLANILDAYETFGAAAKTNALKVLIEGRNLRRAGSSAALSN